jgi:hypothetical protein
MLGLTERQVKRGGLMNTLSRRAARTLVKRVRMFVIGLVLLVASIAAVWSTVSASQAVGGPALVVSTTPDGIALNEPLAVQPTIALTPGDTKTVTVTVDGDATLSGNTATGTGSVSFNNLTFTGGTVGYTYTLTFSAAGYTPVPVTVRMLAVPSIVWVVGQTTSNGLGATMSWINGTLFVDQSNVTVTLAASGTGQTIDSLSTQLSNRNVSLKATTKAMFSGTAVLPTAGNYSLTVKAPIYTQSSAITTRGGNFTVWATNTAAGPSGSPVTGVSVTSGGDVTTNGGDIVVGGGSNPLTSPVAADIGMSMADAKWVASKGGPQGTGTIGTRGGDISIRVKVVKNNALSTAWSQVGLLMDGGTAITQNTQLVTDNSGNININAESDVGDSVDGSGGVVLLQDKNKSGTTGNNAIQTTNGNISITSKPTGYATNTMNPVQFGFALYKPSNCSGCNNSYVRSVGTGSITIDASAGSATSTHKYIDTSAGIYHGGYGAQITTISGSINLTGTSGYFDVPTANAAAFKTYGVVVQSYTYSTSGAITIDGTGGAVSSSPKVQQSTGVAAFGGGVYTSGNFTLTGRGGNAPSATTSASIASVGVDITSSANFGATSGAGAVSITGTGGSIAGAGPLGGQEFLSVGVRGGASGTTGAFTITGTAGDITATTATTGSVTSVGLVGVTGVPVATAATTNAVTLNGTGGAISALTTGSIKSAGAQISSGLTSTASATVTLNATAGPILDTNSTTQPSTAVSIGAWFLTGTNWSLTSTSQLVINGTAGIMNLAKQNTGYDGMEGVKVEAGTLSTVSGNLTINANGSSATTATVNGTSISPSTRAVGLYLSGNATNVQTTNGVISINADAKTSSEPTTDNTAWGQTGLLLSLANVKATGTGRISINASAGTNTSTTGTSCRGVYLAGTLSTVSGAIDVTGTGCANTVATGSRTGLINIGLSSDSGFSVITTSATAGQGNVTLTGTSGEQTGGTLTSKSGILFYTTTAVEKISTAAGSITINGSNHANTSAQTGNVTGIGALTVQATSSAGGDINITGTGTGTNGAGGTVIGYDSALASSTYPVLIDTTGAITITGTGTGSNGFGVRLASSITTATATATSADYALIGKSATSVTINGNGSTSGGAYGYCGGSGFCLKGYWTLGGPTTSTTAAPNITINATSYFGFTAAAGSIQYPLAINTSGTFVFQPATGDSDFKGMRSSAAITAASSKNELGIQPSSRVASVRIGQSTTTAELILQYGITMNTGSLFTFYGSRFTQLQPMTVGKLALLISQQNMVGFAVDLGNVANSFTNVAISCLGANKAVNFASATNWTPQDLASIVAVYGVPSALGFTSTPTTTGSANTNLSTISVGYQDAYGYAISARNSRSSDVISISAAIATGPSTTLDGTTTVSTVSGVAAFSNLKLNSGGVHTLTFTASGLTSVTTASITLDGGPDLTATLNYYSSTNTVTVGGTQGTPTVVAATTGGKSYSSTTLSVCTVNGAGTLTPSHAGTCTVQLVITGDSTYGTTTITRDVVITQATLTLTVSTPSPSSAAWGTSVTMSRTANKTIATTNDVWSVVTGSCSFSGAVLSATAAGDCVVNVSNGGTTDYTSATSSNYTFTFSKKAQAALSVPTGTTIPYQSAGLDLTTLTYTGGNGSGTLSFSTTSSNCAVAAGVLTTTNAAPGTCAISVVRDADANYLVSSAATMTVTVAKINQVALVISTTSGTFGQTLSLATSGGSSTGVVSFTVNSGTCSLNGTLTTLTLGNAGSACSVTATQAGDSNYNPVSSSATSITTAQATQSALTVTSTTVVYGQTLTLTASGGSTGGTATYAVTNGSCSVASAVLTVGDAGSTCEVTATLAGNTNYLPVSSSSTAITITRASQTGVSFTNASSLTYGQTLSLTATGGLGTGAFSFSVTSAGTAGCSISSSTLSVTSAGTCDIAVERAQSTNYTVSASTPLTLTVSKANQTPLTVTSANSVVWGTPLSLTATGGTLTGIVWTKVSGSNCSVTSASLASTGGGTCVVSATISGDNRYNDVTTGNFTVTLDRQTQTALAWGNAVPTSVDYLGSATLSVTGGSGSGAVVYTASQQSTCSTASNILTAGDAASLCEVVATKAGDTDYLPASTSTRTFTIVRIAQDPLSFANADSLVFGDTLTLFATGGSGDGALSYSISSAGTAGCSLAGDVVSVSTAGTCVVQAQKQSSSNYLAGTAITQTLTVSKAMQSLSFTSQVPALPIAGETYSVTASSTSGLNPSFSIVTGGCSVSSGVVTFTASGTCVIRASQPGDARYEAAANIVQTIGIGSRNQSLSFDSATAAISSKLYGAAAFSVVAVSTEPTADITYSRNASVTTNSACAVLPSGLVVIEHVGVCSIDANSAGTSAFLAASTITKTFVVDPAPAAAPFITSVSAGNRAITASFTPPSWDGGTLPSAYELVAVDQTPGSSIVVTQTGCSPILTSGVASCTVNGLDNGVSYKIKVAAITEAGRGDYSDLSTSYVAATNPAAVQQLRVVEGNNNLTISWQDPDSLGGGTFSAYRIFVKRSSASSYDALHYFNVTNNATHSVTVQLESPADGMGYNGGPALQNGTPYDVKIVTVTTANALELAANTTEANKIPRTVPDAPRLVAPIVLGNDVVISWTLPSSDGGSAITGFTASFNGGACSQASPMDTYCTTALPTTPGHYPFEVTAQNIAGQSPAASAVYIVASSNPSPSPSPSVSPSPSPSVSPSPSSSPSVSPSPSPSPTQSTQPSPRASSTKAAAPAASGDKAPAVVTPSPSSSASTGASGGSSPRDPNNPTGDAAGASSSAMTPALLGIGLSLGAIVLALLGVAGYYIRRARR